MRRLALTLALAWIFSGTAPASAQVSAFRRDAAKVPVGRVYEYLKSNRDGSHHGRVTLYVAAADRLEALKWAPGDDTATLVVARIDWTRFSVARFENWQVRRGQPDARRVTLETARDADELRVSVLPEKRIPIRAWPWHSYDFDFAGLGFVLPHLIDPERPVTFERVDATVVGNEFTDFKDLGPVTLRFERREEHEGKSARRYRIGGPGLDGAEGVLWADAAEGHILEFQIPIPDEPGYRDGRLRLQSVGSLTPAGWSERKRACVGDKPAASP
ncbi:MAG: hypothetical protein U0790_16385 [Isosphaeraceae bacterium]